MGNTKFVICMMCLGMALWSESSWARQGSLSFMNIPDARVQLCEMGENRACRMNELASNCRQGDLQMCTDWHREADSLIAGDQVLGMLLGK